MLDINVSRAKRKQLIRLNTASRNIQNPSIASGRAIDASLNRFGLQTVRRRGGAKPRATPSVKTTFVLKRDGYSP
ncbi:unnamed protein product, partial [Iphiclides podalirius]